MCPLKINRLLTVLGFLIALATGYGQASIGDLRRQAKAQFTAGKYPEALKSQLSALTLAEKSKDCYEIAYAHMQVARMHYYLNNKRQALSGFFVARPYVESCGHDTLKGLLYRNIGAIYCELFKTDSALLYLNKSLQFSARTNNYKDLSMASALISDIHFNQGPSQFEAAESYIQRAEKYAVLANDLDSKVFALLKHANQYTYVKNYRMAIKKAKEALALEEKSGDMEGRIFAMRILAEALTAKGDPQARLYYDSFIALRDSIFKKETSDKFADYKISYDTEKKETENKLLLQKNSLSQAEIASKNKTILALLIGVLLIVILVWWRISVMNLKKKNMELEAAQAMQKEKERISRDLHDNVGGQLSYVLFSLEASEDPALEKRKEKAANLAEALRSVTGNLRETIWTLNHQQLSLTSLSDKLKLYAKNMFAWSDTKLKFSENIENDEELNPALALNIYRIGQEIINNSFKHAQATELNISISKAKNTVLSISDNGLGFDERRMQENSYGLSNLKLRAREINAELSIESAPGKGTTVTLIV